MLFNSKLKRKKERKKVSSNDMNGMPVGDIFEVCSIRACAVPCVAGVCGVEGFCACASRAHGVQVDACAAHARLCGGLRHLRTLQRHQRGSLERGTDALSCGSGDDDGEDVVVVVEEEEEKEKEDCCQTPTASTPVFAEHVKKLIHGKVSANASACSCVTCGAVRRAALRRCGVWWVWCGRRGQMGRVCRV